MLQRTSVVDHIKLSLLSFSSTFEIGDANYFQAFSRALAVQRQRKLFYGDEGHFENYAVFSEPISFMPISEELTIHFENIKPIIKVDNIKITAVSSASLLQIGSCRHLFSETRIKHIRQIEKLKTTQNDKHLIHLHSSEIPLQSEDFLQKR